jgi:hypothetical protein
MSNEDLVSWLLEQIDTDEQEAQIEGPWPPYDKSGLESFVYSDTEYVGMNVTHQRILAECDAKRRIIELHRPKSALATAHCEVCADGVDGDGDDCCGYWVEYKPWPCETVKLLALPYADRPGYAEFSA